MKDGASRKVGFDLVRAAPLVEGAGVGVGQMRLRTELRFAFQSQKLAGLVGVVQREKVSCAAMAFLP